MSSILENRDCRGDYQSGNGMSSYKQECEQHRSRAGGGMIFTRGRGRPFQNEGYVGTQPGKGRGRTSSVHVNNSGEQYNDGFYSTDEDYDLNTILKECREVRQTCGGSGECPQSDIIKKHTGIRITERNNKKDTG